MLINRATEVNGRGGDGVSEDRDENVQEYQTASQLFDIMSKDHSRNVTDALTASDLVLLYKNFDVGANLLSNSNLTKKKANQHVETVVYNDDHDSDDSDTSDIYNTDDVNVYDYNKERLDILNSEGSRANTLCQKLGGIEIQTSKLSNEYRHFNIFKDPVIKEQLNFNFGLEDFEGAALPATLLDYICCKRLEDNYNFYMDNIIRYVKHTIEQLKRISNGDYLTDKAKEKWREVNDPVDKTNSTKILATSTSIPLHIERKASNLVSAWDDIVHSEVDVRSLSKILEKKIIVEVPKMICGTYKLFSRRCADNLIISCQRENNLTIEEKKEDSRVDVVLQLEKSHSGHVVSNISSIMILKTQQDVPINEHLPLTYKETEDSFFDATDINSKNKLQIVELNNINEDCDLLPDVKQEDICKIEEVDDEVSPLAIQNDTNEYPCSENDNGFSKNDSCLESTESNDVFRDVDEEQRSQSEFSYEIIPNNELKFTMQRFNNPSSLPEESGDDYSQNTLNKKKSPTRIRIKSPYENQSHILEEKKRRRLLEIREKRERKKMALSENCKISKHKYARSGIMPQASSSVTKLSITNKSFYNSIYGQAVAAEQSKAKNRKCGNNDSILEVSLDHEEEHDAPILTPDAKKFIDRSYYLDDAETEMMYMETKQKEISEIKACSASTFAESSDFRANLTLLSQLIGPSVTDLNAKLNHLISEEKTLSSHKISIVELTEKDKSKAIATTQSIINFAPMNAPKIESAGDINDAKKASSSVECRKSIDKIYDLMKKLEKGDADDSDPPTSKVTSVRSERVNIGRRESSTIQVSDSGTSLKHHLTSSNPSCFSFDKTNIEVTKMKAANKQSEVPVVPKVVISNKVQIIRPDGEKNKKPKRTVISPKLKPQDNPLKAISQLLHEFDNVQKYRQKTSDSKGNKKHEVLSNDVKSNTYQGSSKRRSRLELHLKDTQILDKSPKIISPRKLKTSLGNIRNTRQQPLIEETHDKVPRRITDIIDEVREARGEAVKGPSKFSSRLNSLAQPKKSYVQARIDEHPSRVKTLTDRQQKVATAPLQSDRNIGSPNYRNKVKKTGTEAISAVSVKQPPVQPLDKVVRKRRSANNSPENTSKCPSPVASSKRSNVPPTPETLKKMVAAESYVKNYHRRAPLSSPVQDRHVAAGHRSRIPLLPTDIELASVTSANTAELSTEVGSKLHNMISTMLDIPPDFIVPKENLEISCKKADYSVIPEDLYKGDERGSVDSDYPVDVFEDKHIVTAVEHIANKSIVDKIPADIEIFNSTSEIEKLENAFFQKWPIGAFQKRLRIKNLTLTPKQSMKQIFVLQSGDGSLVIKSSLTKTVSLETNNDIQDLKTLPVLSKTELDWSFSNFPMQIATVGYAFPQCQSPFEVNTQLKSLGDVYATAEPLNHGLESDEDIKAVVEKAKPFMEQIIEDEANTDESSIPALKLKAEEGKINLIQDFVNAIQSCEKTNTSIVNLERGNEASHKLVSHKPDSKNIDYTTSLDILMGLLNEIQTITSCQTHITNNDADEQQCKELETILDDAAVLESLSNSPKELVSITSLDKLRKLESRPSMYTIYLSSDDENDNTSNNIADMTAKAYQPLYVDKQVGVDIGTPEYISQFTDVPSMFPLYVNHGTNVTYSRIGVLSRPSSQSMFSSMEYQTLYSNTSFNTYKKIVQLPQHAIEEAKDKSPNNCVAVCKEKGKLNEKLNFDSCKILVPCNETAKKMNQKLIRCKKLVKEESYVPDFDPMLKIKRDILVTVYSILVITVFAALSFPDVLYHV